ncbi:MFS transporter [Rhodococcus maanshanensis]|uniref:Predicted arabinose efflux permease, MFS family n=1 Tax=Rhodococcus maanshanensis TaxID=183556 RepID=A0A1H7YBT7_9NOCA|nr:MFS transporter [Rhodococcus maanshanensis]SEM43425.1 Predicted arabinose efflux permease, MFS family [Rhodococcus maanshanensis]
MTQLTRVLPDESRTAGPHQISALWLALLASPIALSANSPVLILPEMADSFGVSTATVTWLVTVFAWAMAVGTPLMATLLRRRGPRLTLGVGGALIVAGTALVAVAPWLPLAMAGRAAQAVGGAGLATVAMTLAGTARRMGAITAGFGILGAMGPLVGSLIAEAASWRAALAISLVALLVVPVVIRRSQDAVPAATAPFDGRGAALLVSAVSALVLVPRYPAPAVVAAIVMGVVLAAHIRRRPDGFVPAALLRSPVFVGSTLLACAVATSYFTLLFTIPQLLRDRTEWSTAAIGAGQLVALLTGSALSLVLAAAAVWIGRSRVLAVLIAVAVLAPLTAALTPWAPLLLVAATLAVFATTAGQATLAVYATAAAPESQRPTTIGLFNLCYQLGGAFGPAIAALIVLG